MKTLRIDIDELSTRLCELPEIEGIDAPQHPGAPITIRLAGSFGGRKLSAGCLPAADGSLTFIVPHLVRIPSEELVGLAIHLLLELNGVLSGTLELGDRDVLHYRLTEPGPRADQVLPDLLRLLIEDLHLGLNAIYGMLVHFVLPIDAATAKRLILPLAPVPEALGSDPTGLPKMTI